jgi:hypothetical protein
MRERARVIAEAATEAGRPMPTMSARLAIRFDHTKRGVSVLSGPADEMAAALRAYVENGTEHFALDFGTVDPDAVARAIERFHREVIPAL